MLPSAYTMHRKKIRKATMLHSNYFLENKAKKYIKCMIHKEHINSSKVRYISLGSFFLQCITHTLTHFRHRLLHIFWGGKTRAITTKGHKNIVAMLAPFFPLHVDLTNFLWSKFGLFRLCSCFFFRGHQLSVVLAKVDLIFGDRSVHIGDIKRSDYDRLGQKGHKPDPGSCQMKLKKCNDQMSPLGFSYAKGKSEAECVHLSNFDWSQTEGKHKINRFVVSSKSYKWHKILRAKSNSFVFVLANTVKWVREMIYYVLYTMLKPRAMIAGY